MIPSNEPSRGRRASRPRAFAGRVATALRLRVAALLLAGAAGCDRPDSASLQQDVQLDVAHDPPSRAPAGEPLLLGLRVTASPPLPAESAHLWWTAESDWVRATLEPLAGTDRLEAQLPPQPRGRVVRYYFTVRSALGDTLRLPAGGNASAAPSYELLVRGPVEPWASAARVLAPLVALGTVLAGAWSVRPRGERAAAGRLAGVLVVAGVAIFALGLVAAAVASAQATGNAVREVPEAWWAALLLWLLLVPLVLAMRRRDGAPPRAPRVLAVLALGLAFAGAAAAVAGLAALA